MPTNAAYEVGGQAAADEAAECDLQGGGRVSFEEGHVHVGEEEGRSSL